MRAKTSASQAWVDVVELGGDDQRVHERGERAAAIYSLIETTKLNGVDPEAWLRDTIARIADHPARRIDELLPWNYFAA